MTTTKYTQRACDTCGMTIMVATYDVTHRNYCQTCAYSKLGAVGLSYTPNEGVAHE